MRVTKIIVFSTLLLLGGGLWSGRAAEEPLKAELENFSINGGVEDGRATLVIEAVLKGLSYDDQALLYSTTLEQSVHASPDKLTHAFSLSLDILQGQPKEIPLTLAGDGEIRSVEGEGLLDWSIRWGANATRYLVLRFAESEEPIEQFTGTITAESELKTLPASPTLLTLTPEKPALFGGYLVLTAEPAVTAQLNKPNGLVPMKVEFLPETLRRSLKSKEDTAFAFRFHGTGYSVSLRVRTLDPEERQVILRDFHLAGALGDESATFTLTATAHVKSPTGGELTLLTGDVALTGFERTRGWDLHLENGHYVFTCEEAGEFPITLTFNAAIQQASEWQAVQFRVAPSTLQPVSFSGLAADTEFQFAGAAKPELKGEDFVSFLPADGTVKFSWKSTREEAEGRLFYAAEMLSQIRISPGLMSQVSLLDFKVMQGEMNQIVFLLHGEGEVTRVQGDTVLSWTVEAIGDSGDRRLVARLNEAQTGQFAIVVQTQTPLGAFPQAANAIHIQPEGATRFAGYHRIVNEGAVRLEVVDASGLSQIAPEQFPQSDRTQAILPVSGSQRFVYRFSGPDFSLRIQADNILPEISVSQILAYRLGETETTIDAEIELDIREAPVRELILNLPLGYTIAHLNASDLSDYFQHENDEDGSIELRLVYGQPISGRQLIQFRLERNQTQGGESWELPRIAVVNAKSTRGYVGVSADAGFRLTPERVEGLTEIATAFFPKKLADIQAGFRLSDASWTATMRVERLPQTVQAESFHLFSIGEGIAYGSSTMNFLVSGAPISTFHLQLSDEYFNVEFAGKDLRNWQKTNDGYIVQLHTPVAGAYTLLATYERPFKSQGDTLTFVGARPLDAETEQGHTIVISAYQFQVKPANVSAGLLELEPAEVPPEYRLFFDTPILKAYRYASRPFNLQLELSPLEQGETVSLVVDRAALVTRISKEDEVVTDATYFIKNRGNPHLRLTLPEGVKLWSALIDGAPVVPVIDETSNLIPLPQRNNPDALLRLDLKLAARSESAKHVHVAAPKVSAPILLAEWRLVADTGRRLVYRSGTLTPEEGIQDLSGFAGLAQTFRGNRAGEAWRLTLMAVALLGIGILLWRRASVEGVTRFSTRHVIGALMGLLAFALVTGAIARLGKLASYENGEPPRNVTLLAPVQQSDSALTVKVDNVLQTQSAITAGSTIVPLILAIGVWIYSIATSRKWLKPIGWLFGWTLLAWATLSWSNGAPAFFGLIWIFLLVQIALPGLRRLLAVSGRPPSEPPNHTSAATAILLATLCVGSTTFAADAPSSPIAESVVQDIQVQEDYAFATVSIRWHAEAGQLLPVLYQPAVLTEIRYPTKSLKLVQAPANARQAHQLLALESGIYDVELDYQIKVQNSGIPVCTQYGLVNRVKAVLVDRDVDITHRHAVSVQRSMSGNNTVADLVFSPTNEAWLGWKPRSRDARTEAAVFYAELHQLYVPSAGVIEGMHDALIRPAQGEVSELVFDIPQGATITDVDSAIAVLAGDQNPAHVSLWRFDPDVRQLRVQLSQPKSKPFSVRILSQVATGPLPLEHSVGLVSVRDAAGQIGMFGIGSGAEVQLDEVQVEGFTAINLDDFPAGVIHDFKPQVRGLTLRRAFRYAQPEGSVRITASAVEPDVRVTTQETLSLGEDRTVLAVNATVNVTRAGIFRLSFVLPETLDVESVSGEALSHWTELKTGERRVITLHLTGKTEGQQTFAISLAGSGLSTTQGWSVPHLHFREATKQQGQLVVVPEQGMRLQIADRNGVTQLDPQRAGIRQRGVLAFRLLQADWTLALDIEQVDAWVQVTSLQHFNVSEAQIKVSANLEYEIENTGLKAFRVLLPANAESVHIAGDQLSDFLEAGDAPENGLQAWEVKLHRRVIGSYLLQITYQLRLPEQADATTLHGLQADGVNLQRGFVTIYSEGRLQVRVDSPPASLQPAEWQSIPRTLQQDLAGYSANYTFRLVEPSYELPLQLVRHAAVRLLPARVNSILLTSVISDEGVMLTKVRMEMTPGDKRLLNLTLPENARFWFSFVNDNGTWPWRDGDRILIPLEQQSRSDQPVPVEFLYSSQIGSPGQGSLDLAMLGPEFDLPLENITWQVYLNKKWDLNRWSGTLQLEEHGSASGSLSINVNDYLANEVRLQKEQTQAAEEWMELGNQMLQTGDPQQARAAFRNAYGLSQHDAAFNEDARVQLNNLRVQQALMGLNFGQADLAGADDQAAQQLRAFKQRKGVAYTQEEAQQVFAGNRAEDNANFTRLAERIIQQQDAAVSAPAAIRATIPEQGRLLTFRRSVQVDQWADMNISLKATAASTVTWGVRLMILIASFAVFGVLRLGSRAVKPR